LNRYWIGASRKNGERAVGKDMWVGCVREKGENEIDLKNCGSPWKKRSGPCGGEGRKKKRA